MTNRIEEYLSTKRAEEISQAVLSTVEPGARSIVMMVMLGKMRQEDAEALIHGSVLAAMSLYITGVALPTVGELSAENAFTDAEEDSLMKFQELCMGKVFGHLNQRLAQATAQLQEKPEAPKKELYIPGSK